MYIYKIIIQLNFTTVIIEKLKDLSNRVNEYLNITTEWNKSIDRLYNVRKYK